jgi:hypothetical protein
MKALLGFLLILAGIALGIYIGFWAMFVGGIVGLVNIFKSGAIEAMPIALNIAKIIFASFVGVISAYVLIIPGYVLMND